MKVNVQIVTLLVVILLTSDSQQNSAQLPQSQLDLLLCNANDNSKTYARGDQIVICLQLIPHNVKISYTVNVDTYTALKMKGTYLYVKSQSVTANKETYLMAQANYGKMATFPANKSSSSVSSVYSLVVQLHEGKVMQSKWDLGCFGCNGASCGRFNDYLSTTTYTNCQVNPICNDANTLSCDPQVYVSFVGTDINGNYMVSAGQRISRYQSFSIGDMYQAALSLKY